MGRRNSFDFAHTCPNIDKAIDSCKSRLESYLTDYIIKLSASRNVEKHSESNLRLI
jgi:hypothetical protein